MGVTERVESLVVLVLAPERLSFENHLRIKKEGIILWK